MNRLTRWTWLASLLLTCALCAEEIPENLFPDQSFRSWSETAERRFTPNGGQNGFPGLIVERKDPAVFDFKMEKMFMNPHYKEWAEKHGKELKKRITI